MQIVRGTDRKRMPWKNGIGVTEEIAVFPADRDAASFDWRLSIAHVGEDGPFSTFPGVDRTIALLDGSGLALDLPAGQTVTLEPNGAPFAFSGDWSIAGRNLGGPTVDLNIMTLRGYCTHAMQRLTLAAQSTLAPSGLCWAIFNMPAKIEWSGQTYALDRLDAISLTAGESAICLTEARILLIEISERHS